MKNITSTIFAGLALGLPFALVTQSVGAQSSMQASSSFKDAQVEVQTSPYAKTSDGLDVSQFTLKNANGMTVKLINFGARVIEISVPDKNGKIENILLNQPDLASYETNKNYLGPIVGRFGNRLGNSQFTIDGKVYKVPANENDNALHGGTKGFDLQVWNAEIVKGDGFAGVKFSRVSPDGEMGFPGNLNVEAFFKLNNNNELSVEYTATTDKTTVCNLTLHPYFNLAGAGNGNILTHLMQIPAETITEVDSELIPTGKVLAVKDTPFDFNQMRPVGERIKDFSDKQLKIAGGYDHNFNLSKPVDVMGLACRIYHPKSGRVLEIFTQEPALQFYSGHGFDGTVKGANGKAFYKYAALVLEPQHAPDTPNQDFFPSTTITPGEVFTSKSIYRFSVFDSDNTKPIQ